MSYKRITYVYKSSCDYIGSLIQFNYREQYPQIFRKVDTQRVKL